MQLFLLRHGPAEERDEWQGDDADRPLTADGKLLVADVGRTLARQGIRPDAIITSPLVRSTQTAEILGECFAAPEKVVMDDTLGPGFGANELAKLLAAYEDRQVLILVGHNPDFSDLARSLTGGSRLSIRKGGFAQVKLSDPKILKGRLVSLMVPTPTISGPPAPDSDT